MCRVTLYAYVILLYVFEFIHYCLYLKDTLKDILKILILWRSWQLHFLLMTWTTKYNNSIYSYIMAFVHNFIKCFWNTWVIARQNLAEMTTVILMWVEINKVNWQIRKKRKLKYKRGKHNITRDGKDSQDHPVQLQTYHQYFPLNHFPQYNT